MHLHTFGWDDGWSAVLPSGHDPARVVAVHRGRVVVEPERRQLPVLTDEQPLVGDWVGVRDGAVRVVLPRRTLLARDGGSASRSFAGQVANADLGVVVTSLNADLSHRRVERFVALARAGGVEPLVVLSKGDLAGDPSAAVEEAEQRLGVDVIALSAVDGWGVPALRSRLVAGRTAALVGMSGVGKSTLVNLLLGEERQKTLAVREDDARGRHATTHRELFVLDDGALLVDTPGVRSPGMTGTEGLDETFADIAALAAGCRFGDCRHDGEPGCAVAGAVDPDRLASLRKLEREGLSARERNEQHREFSRMYRKDVARRTRHR